MSTKPIFHRLELNFWNYIIPLIEESTLVGFTLTRTYNLFESGVFVRLIVPLTLSALLGLAVGFLLGVVSLAL